MSPSPALTIPEIGPSLGRLVSPTATATGAAVPLDDIRLKLVSQLFEMTGDARRWLREGDRELALATLNREAWESCWHTAVFAVAERIAEKANGRMLAAAREARIPVRRTGTLTLDDEEVHALAARLGRGSDALQESLKQLEGAAHHVRGDRAPAPVVLAWQDALATTARRLEAAWLKLEELVAEEWRRWEMETAELKRWRRPLWPLAITGLATFGVLLYLGLVVGGYLPVPGLLRPAAEWIWARWN